MRTSPASWIPWIRLAAVPFVLLEVGVERGNYPPGDERWAWLLAATLAVGALLLTRVRLPLAGLAFDLLLVSGFVVLYGFEPSSPVRQLFFLTAIEGALVFRLWGGLGAIAASAPALAVFERRAADSLDVDYDLGHVLGPLGLQLLVVLVVTALARRLEQELARDR